MNIFVFTASNQTAQQHLRDTVEESVDENILRDFLPADDFNNLTAAAQGDGYYCWGATPGPNNEKNWNFIETGDKILSYWNSEYHHLSTIIFKVRNSQLAERLWGTLDGETWEFMYFFRKPIKFDNPKPTLATSDYLQSRYMGFAKIKEEKVERIYNEFGSLENLLNINILPVPALNQAAIFSLRNQNMNILTAIKTKPFILLAGISGTGKSRLVRTLAYQSCAKESLRTNPKKPGNFDLIPVRPNWHESSEIIGYVSRINGEKYITTAFLKFIGKAWRNKDVPFFLCLDEMNLAPVEQYFAEYLSILETRQVINDELVTDFLISRDSFENKDLYSQLLDDLELNETDFPEGISLPANLVVIGTVNMDETTHSFSRKVPDRAMTFEMNTIDFTKGLELTQNDWSYPEIFISREEIIGKYTSGAEICSLPFTEKEEVIRFLENINNVLEGSPFKIAYRVRDEFLIYCYYASLTPMTNWLENALDEMTCMKILSRIEGDEAKTGNILKNLQRVVGSDFNKSAAKLKEMELRLQTSGYTSFWF